MKVFIAHKYNPKSYPEVLEFLKYLLTSQGHTPYVFLDEGYIANDTEMMEKAMAKLDGSDALIVDASGDSIGIGIEAGYFYTKKKPIIMIYKRGTKASRTLKGIATEIYEYGEPEDLMHKINFDNSIFP